MRLHVLTNCQYYNDLSCVIMYSFYHTAVRLPFFLRDSEKRRIPKSQRAPLTSKQKAVDCSNYHRTQPFFREHGWCGKKLNRPFSCFFSLIIESGSLVLRGTGMRQSGVLWRSTNLRAPLQSGSFLSSLQLTACTKRRQYRSFLASRLYMQFLPWFQLCSKWLTKTVRRDD